ncbi:hypothetical protein FOA52_006173 [Chlamydomonas sp. UWO 241]|nr:hypothetical protein FOA52_006173 [Chlamydomonas sp. UWO 241]
MEASRIVGRLVGAIAVRGGRGGSGVAEALGPLAWPGSARLGVSALPPSASPCSVSGRSSGGDDCGSSTGNSSGAWPAISLGWAAQRTHAACAAPLGTRAYSSAALPVSLTSLRDNPGATKKRNRVGRGNARNGNYCGRGMNGHNSRSGGGPHLLWDGGQLGLLKFPVRRERPPYEVLYTQLGLGKVLEYIQLGVLRHDRVITMKDLQDAGCVSRVKYGVLLYGKAPIRFPVHLQVTACDPETKAQIEAAGGTVTRVYYEEEGLRALLRPGAFTRGNLPLPLPAHSWHPRYNGKFDAIGAPGGGVAVQEALGAGAATTSGTAASL